MSSEEEEGRVVYKDHFCVTRKIVQYKETCDRCCTLFNEEYRRYSKDAYNWRIFVGICRLRDERVLPPEILYMIERYLWDPPREPLLHCTFEHTLEKLKKIRVAVQESINLEVLRILIEEEEN